MSSSCYLLLFIASSWPDVQSPLLDAVHLSGRCAVPPIAAEVRSDIDGTYCAHATTIFRACEYALMLDARKPQYSGLLVVSCFLLAYYSLENCRDPQFGPWLSLTNKVSM